MAMLDDLEELSQRLHCNVVLPVPPLCRKILDQARAEGIAFGHVYIVCRPLQPGVQGSYDRQTRDMWCHYDGSLGQEGQRALVQSLLSMLAALQQDAPLPQSIEEDWAFMRQAHQGGFVLACKWGLEAFFTPQDAERLQMRDRSHFYCHLAAGRLAGHSAPIVARNAYFALLALREAQGWSEEQFEEVLRGTSTDQAANALAPLFDRSYLRRRWNTIQIRSSAEVAGFGPAQVPTSQAGTHLRSILARVFEQQAARRSIRAPFLVQAQNSHWFSSLCNDTDLSALVTLLNTWLIDEYPEAAVRMSWWCYADPSQASQLTPHLYRGEIRYEDLRACTLWVFCDATPHTRRQEAAWQAFLRSWLSFAELCCAPLAEGVQALWKLFQE